MFTNFILYKKIMRYNIITLFRKKIVKKLKTPRIKKKNNKK